MLIRKVLNSYLRKTSLNGSKLRCEILAKISISSPSNTKKIVREKNVLSKSCRQFYVIGDDFFYFDKIAKFFGEIMT